MQAYIFRFWGRLNDFKKSPEFLTGKVPIFPKNCPRTVKIKKIHFLLGARVLVCNPGGPVLYAPVNNLVQVQVQVHFKFIYLNRNNHYCNSSYTVNSVFKRYIMINTLTSARHKKRYCLCLKYHKQQE